MEFRQLKVTLNMLNVSSFVEKALPALSLQEAMSFHVSVWKASNSHALLQGIQSNQ